MDDGWIGAAVDVLLGSTCAGCSRPGRVLCPACRASTVARPRRCRPDPCPVLLGVGGAPPYAGGEYADVLRRLIVGYKDEGFAGLGGPLGGMLADVVEYALAAEPAPVDPPAEPVVELVPVPSSRASRRRRGRDPVGELARAAARQLRRRGRRVVLADRLTHRRTVLDQAGLDASERAANLHGALTTRWWQPLPSGPDGRVRLVVDDVLTTGATAAEAVRVLTLAGWPVTAVATVAATRRRRPGPAGGVDVGAGQG